MLPLLLSPIGSYPDHHPSRAALWHKMIVVSGKRPQIRELATEAAEAPPASPGCAMEQGELTVTTPQEVALVRRLQGALTALEAVDGPSGCRATRPLGLTARCRLSSSVLQQAKPMWR
jgi:hypothetical protein